MFRVGEAVSGQQTVEALVSRSLALPRSNEPLPIFVHAGADAFRVDTPDGIVSRLLPALPGGWRAVRSWWRPSRLRDPFELPLSITVIGERGEDALSRFQQHGFVSAAWAGGTVSIEFLDTPMHLTLTSAPDVLIATADDAEDAITRLRPQNRPRLLIALDAGSESLAEAEDLIRDSAYIQLSGAMDPRAVVDEILLSIVHDEPFHRWATELSNAGFLIADARTNQLLRMSDAFAAEARRDLETSIGASTPRKRALLAIDDDVLRDFGITFSGEGSDGGALERGISDEPRTQPLDLRFQFDRESHGLIPLTRAIAPAAQWDVLEGAIPIAQDDVEHRRVDARIERVEYVPSVDRWRTAAEALWVGADRTLRRGARYRLRVQVGRTAAGNLIPTSVPDLVLPPTPHEYWVLDVVVFGKDFEVRGTSQHKLTLPKRGASQAVYFDLIAPPAGDAAQLRFALYLGNQILQSFRLDAVLANEENEYLGALRVDLDLAKSKAFANLDTLGPRALSIGINDNAAAGTHSLFIKIGDANESLTLTAQEVDPQVIELRQVLENASVNGAVPRFPADDVPLDAVQLQAFETTIRQLARIGGKLRNALFNRASKGMRQRLRDISGLEGKTLQFPRYASNFTVPWRVIYDFGLPKDEQAAEVCGGLAGGTVCGHKAGTQAFCINGFWGIRHAIEEHLASSVGDVRREVVSVAGQPKVRAADGEDDGYCEAMKDDLNGPLELGAGAVTIVGAAEHIFDDILWKNRPPVMMFLGHLDEDRRIKLPGNPQWLTADEITDYAANAPADWDQPHSIILLMACDAMNMNASTLNDHALALTAAGAAAVVGPECRIFSPFACRVAEDLIVALLKNGKTLGVALSDFRRHLVRAGNPLGFAFTAYGDADVAIV
ncbi:MAG: hypothetical protein M3P06_05680 [Acidobacteriota bacterium]|nr:hypothetical protein [Acidobacteriota bacterium]